jgi:hypothetical protein
MIIYIPIHPTPKTRPPLNAGAEENHSPWKEIPMLDGLLYPLKGPQAF